MHSTWISVLELSRNIIRSNYTGPKCCTVRCTTLLLLVYSIQYHTTLCYIISWQRHISASSCLQCCPPGLLGSHPAVALSISTTGGHIMSYQRSLMLIEVCPTDSCHWHDYSLTQQKRIVPQLVPIGLRSNSGGTTSVFMISTPLVYQVGFNYDSMIAISASTMIPLSTMIHDLAPISLSNGSNYDFWVLLTLAAFRNVYIICRNLLQLTGRGRWPKSSLLDSHHGEPREPRIT